MTARKTTTAPAAAKRTRKTTPAPDPVVETPVDLSSITNPELAQIASSEWKAAKAAKAAGRTIPATPHLEELNRRNAAGVVVKRDKSGAPKLPKVNVQFYRGGKAMPKSQNALSSLAYQCTRGIGGPDTVRVTTTALIELLGKLGVESPASSSWDVTLPNGVLLSARVEGDETPVPQPEAKPTSTSSKSTKASKAAPAVKTPARKRTAAKSTASKTAAVKTPAKRSTRKAS